MIGRRTRKPRVNITSPSDTPSAESQLVTEARPVSTIPRASDVLRTPVASRTLKQSAPDASPARTPRSSYVLPVYQRVLRDTTPAANDISISLGRGPPGRLGGPVREEPRRSSDRFKNLAYASTSRWI